MELCFDNVDGNEITIDGSSLEELAQQFAKSEPRNDSAKVENEQGFTVGWVHADGTWRYA